MAYEGGVDAEDVAYELWGEYVVGLTVCDEAPSGHDGKAIARRGGEIEIVEHDEHGELCCRQVREHVDLVTHIEVVRRLVEDEYRRLLCKCPCDEYALAFTAGKCGDGPFGEVEHTELLHRVCADVALVFRKRFVAAVVR